MRVKEAAVTALYAALTPTVVKPHPDLADIEADARYTQAVAAEWALRFQLAKKVTA
jgi:hypothetical protein